MRESEIRRNEIVRLAKNGGLTSVDELSSLFEVTASTIRRDLNHLTERGLLARTYGGAIALNGHHEASIKQRSLEGYDAKRIIAAWAAEQVLPGETVLLDAGTTVGAMGEFLRGATDLTVIAAGLTALEALADAESVRVECLGGTLRHLSQGFVGPLAEASLQRVSFDRAFLGADAVTAEFGICEAGYDQTRLKELMMERAGKIYVLAHSTKLGQKPFHAWAPIPAGTTLVTDSGATPEQIEPFEKAAIDVVIV
ncbi:DeoR/GlpR family DNA-binding transcription regulator [Rhodococcus sp. Eu-32]|uniref:DeoR/GlpR family DNA-binding transcription regulator n=1 Tax=Rhodococcus sp. Eu-32 TaxID=1017319 RepID=UPI001FB53633|nr:DeoR/GlpR family DNA-binding transcription regulator [Rhodococcus sp. Eu-32]